MTPALDGRTLRRFHAVVATLLVWLFAPAVSAEGGDAPAPLAEGGAPSAGQSRDPADRAGYRLALQTEGAIGLTKPSFYNHLLGVRLDYVFPEDLTLGGYLGYANLKGKDGRASNVLPYLMLEYRLHTSSSSRLRIPLRFESGYLPKNGPFLRLSAGVAVPIGETTRLGFDLLAPTFWIVQNRTVVSLDLAAEVSFAL